MMLRSLHRSIYQRRLRNPGWRGRAGARPRPLGNPSEAGGFHRLDLSAAILSPCNHSALEHCGDGAAGYRRQLRTAAMFNDSPMPVVPLQRRGSDVGSLELRDTEADVPSSQRPV